MKNKAPLALMEQLVMILVFALAAALCLRLFALSDALSSSGAVRDQAVIAVQNAAETLKMSGGSFDKLSELAGGAVEDGVWRLDYDAQWNAAQQNKAVYTVTAERKETGHPLLGGADVCARSADGKALFAVSVCWQEDGHE